jgi:putative FmdB family regulatory protein
LPTYQYSCTECGHFFEQFQSFSEDSLTVCPQCEGRLRKVFNAVGVVFKGSGFYRTDSRAADSTTTASTSGSSSDSGSSTTTTTTDHRPLPLRPDL